MLEPFRGSVPEDGDSARVWGGILIYAVCGSFSHFDMVSNEGEPFAFSLFSRRSRHRAGVRFFSRGIDHMGNVSNFVETEQVSIAPPRSHGGASHAPHIGPSDSQRPDVQRPFHTSARAICPLCNGPITGRCATARAIRILPAAGLPPAGQELSSSSSSDRMIARRLTCCAGGLVRGRDNGLRCCPGQHSAFLAGGGGDRDAQAAAEGDKGAESHGEPCIWMSPSPSLGLSTDVDGSRDSKPTRKILNRKQKTL